MNVRGVSESSEKSYMKWLHWTIWLCIDYECENFTETTQT